MFIVFAVPIIRHGLQALVLSDRFL